MLQKERISKVMITHKTSIQSKLALITTIIFLFVATATTTSAFIPIKAQPQHLTNSPCSSSSWGIAQTRLQQYKTILHMGVSNTIIDVTDDDEEDEEELVEAGSMRISEIKSELKLRNVDFSDCFDKESLVNKLEDARKSGKADPSIVDKFNKQSLENAFEERKVKLEDEDIEKAVAADGTLPGGFPPEMLKKLTSNPELMSLLQNPKMQDAMKLMMTGGQGPLEEKMKEDRELREIVTKLSDIMKGAM